LAIHGLIPGTGQEMFILSKTSIPALGPIYEWVPETFAENKAAGAWGSPPISN
jgi:hypothetical protein